MKKLFKAMMLGCTIAGVGQTTAWVTARTEREAKDMLAWYSPYAKDVKILKVERASDEERECGEALAAEIAAARPVDSDKAFEEIFG